MSNDDARYVLRKNTHCKVENKQICCIPHVFIPSDYTDD